MKKYYLLIIVALILGIVLTGCTLLSNVGQVPATDQSGISYSTKGSSFTVGNDDTVRPYTDSYSNFTIIDTNNSSSELGLLNTFSYYAKNSNPFRFVLVDESDVVQWVSAEITPSAPGVQSWSPSTPVYVEPGWNLGLYFALAGTVTWEYAGAPAWYEPNNTGLPNVGDTLSYANSSNRIYSFVATGEVAELPSVPIITWPANGACITPAALTHIDWDDSTGTFTPLEYQYQAYKYANYTTLIYSSSWLSASQIPTPGTPERVYYIRVRAQDSMGNLSDWSNGSANPYKITVDKTPPVVNITAPVNGVFYPVGAVPTLAYTVTDNLDPSPVVVEEGYFINPGEHTVTVTATDCAGNVGSDSVTYYVLEIFVTGGGKINMSTLELGGKKAALTFGGTVGVFEGEGIVGQFQIVDHASLLREGKGAVSWHCNNFNYLEFSGEPAVSPEAAYNTATFEGNFTSNRGDILTIELKIIDKGEPGAGFDTFSIYDDVWYEWPIDGGNFQVHDIEY